VGPAHPHSLDDRHVGHDRLDRANGVVVCRALRSGPAAAHQQAQAERPHLWAKWARVGRVGSDCRAARPRRLVLPASGLSTMTLTKPAIDREFPEMRPFTKAVRHAPRS